MKLINQFVILRYVFVSVIVIILTTSWGNAEPYMHNDDDYSASLRKSLSDISDNGNLYVTDSTLHFGPNRRKAQEVVRLKDIISVVKQSKTELAIASNDGQTFVFTVKRREMDEIIESIVRHRNQYFEEVGLEASALLVKDLTNDRLNYVNDRFLKDENINQVASNYGSPDIILSLDGTIIEAMVVTIDEEAGEVTYFEYPVVDLAVMKSMSLAQVEKINLGVGQEFNFNLSSKIVKNDLLLNTKDLWVRNSETQKLTYETVARYFDESEIERYRQIRHKGNTGKVFLYVGCGIFAVDVVLLELGVAEDLMEGAFQHDDPVPLIVYGSTVLLGGIFAIVGSSIYFGARKSLASLVNEYNINHKIALNNSVTIGKTNSGFGIAYNF